MRAARRLDLLEMRQRGFEDGIADSETEPLDMDAEEEREYRRARDRGEQTAKALIRNAEKRMGKRVARSIASRIRPAA